MMVLILGTAFERVGFRKAAALQPCDFARARAAEDSSALDVDIDSFAVGPGNCVGPGLFCGRMCFTCHARPVVGISAGVSRSGLVWSG